MLTLLLECWKTHFNHEEEIRCCLSYLIVGKGVRGHVHGGAVWSARGPLSHGRDNKVQTRAKNRNILKQAKYLWVIFLTAACQAQEAHIKNKRLNFFIQVSHRQHVKRGCRRCSRGGSSSSECACLPGGRCVSYFSFSSFFVPGRCFLFSFLFFA